MNENTIKVAKGIFGFVFENRNELNLPIYQTLMHDLGIIIRGDDMAVPYTVKNLELTEELMADRPDATVRYAAGSELEIKA